MSKELATIITNVPIEVKLEDLEYGDYNKDDVVEKFKEFGFTSLITKLLDIEGGETTIKEEIDLKVHAPSYRIPEPCTGENRDQRDYNNATDGAYDRRPGQSQRK